MNRMPNCKPNRTLTAKFSFFPSTHQVPQAFLLAAALAGLAAGGCKSNTPAPIISNGNNGSVTDAGPAPADGNLAPVSGQPTEVLGQTSSYAPQQSGESYSEAPDQQEQAGADALLQADQPPPPLPDYEQPPDYIWTPGYWAYGSGGYYWVPGAWCPPPYYGALWTPPYWGYDGGHYRFHRGYWGPHIGYYGGVDYGFGYIGIGFFGGYWLGHDFYYNRAVTNVGHVNNVYNREVVYNNVHYSAQPANRISYNGGRGGLNARPQPAELAATREYHTPPVAVQSQDRQAAAQNHQQFYAANHGRPAQAVLARPAVANAHIAEPPAPAAAQIQHANQVQQHSAQPQQHTAPTQPQEQQRAAQQEQHTPPVQQEHVQPQQRAAQPLEPPRTMQSQQQRQQENRPAPAAEARPAPQPHAEAVPRPAAPQPRPAAAPAPRPTPEARPAPAPHAEAPHDAPHEAPHEAPKEEGHPRSM
jgi:hypothetical protein